MSAERPVQFINIQPTRPRTRRVPKPITWGTAFVLGGLVIGPTAGCTDGARPGPTVTETKIVTVSPTTSVPSESIRPTTSTPDVSPTSTSPDATPSFALTKNTRVSVDTLMSKIQRKVDSWSTRTRDPKERYDEIKDETIGGQHYQARLTDTGITYPIDNRQPNGGQECRFYVEGTVGDETAPQTLPDSYTVTVGEFRGSTTSIKGASPITAYTIARTPTGNYILSISETKAGKKTTTTYASTPEGDEQQLTQEIAAGAVIEMRDMSRRADDRAPIETIK